jgi:hypothetical protein
MREAYVQAEIFLRLRTEQNGSALLNWLYSRRNVPLNF